MSPVYEDGSTEGTGQGCAGPAVPRGPAARVAGKSGDQQPEWRTASSRQVRQATPMTVDRQTITATIFSGTPTMCADFSSPVVQGCSTTIGGEFCTFNPPRPRHNWAAAGGSRARSRSPPTQTARTGAGLRQPATASHDSRLGSEGLAGTDLCQGRRLEGTLTATTPASMPS